MDYKKKYENALEWARQVINGECGFIRNEVEEVFPELKESDDEKVRKAIIELVLQSSEILGSNNQSRMLAWLEKQGKRLTPINIDEMVYKYGNTKESCTNGLPVNCQIRAYRQGINDTLNLVFNLEKQGEQNYEFHGIAESRPAKGKLKELCQELSQSEATKKSDQDDIDALEQAMYALESFIVEDKPDKCFAGHRVPFIKAIEKLKSLKERIS